jgi:adenylosuccinate lyase
MNNILTERYASPEMAHIFSRENRYGKWRLVWLALAEAQSELGFPVSPENVKKVRETADQIDFARVKEIEAETRHDVMAHLKYWAEICPEVNNTIHIGATSCYVTDNAECVLHKEALHHIILQIQELYEALEHQAFLTAYMPVLGYTHFQPASPTTIGKRITMWMQDLIGDYDELVRFHDDMLCRGAKGTTGTQASYLEMVGSDSDKVRQLDRLIARKLRFKGSVELSGQTISRKQDARIGDLLSGIAISLSKIGHDVRLLSHTGDLREGFGPGQVGSSAMPYKRNPMLAERLCALTRLVPQYREMLTQVAMTQWLERSLDDSATRRVAIPDMFLAINSALNTAIKLAKGLAPTEALELKDGSFLASELLLARAVKQGFSRQLAHERLKDYSLEARKSVNPKMAFYMALMKDEIWENDYLAKNLNALELCELTGLAAEQAMGFLKRHKNYFS